MDIVIVYHRNKNNQLYIDVIYCNTDINRQMEKEMVDVDGYELFCSMKLQEKSEQSLSLDSVECACRNYLASEEKARTVVVETAGLGEDNT